MNDLQFSFVYDKHLSKQLLNDLRHWVLLNVTGFLNAVFDILPSNRLLAVRLTLQKLDSRSFEFSTHYFYVSYRSMLEQLQKVVENLKLVR